MYKITIQNAPLRNEIGFVVLKIFSKTPVFIESEQAIVYEGCSLILVIDSISP